jgi:hypothetical protein
LRKFGFDWFDIAMARTSDSVTPRHILADRLRCPEESLAEINISASLSDQIGYFRFGPDIVCYGHCASGAPGTTWEDNTHDAGPHITTNGSTVNLPFDPAEVIDNLRRERYRAAAPKNLSRVLRAVYYAVRPALGVSVRRYIQRFYFRGWDKVLFPKWPVDTTVENILENLLVTSMKAKGLTRIPFIWFWPDGAPTCTIMTHDIETSTGLQFCSQLMDLDDAFNIKSSFQVVPEKRYQVSPSALENMRDRGFEVNVHDLNHDGRLMNDREEFRRRAKRINAYRYQFGSQGFRAAIMYRNTDWYDMLDFLYDMSIPNSAHLEPQQGGCCSVLPFFVGNMLELPLTTIQDYSLFNILNDYSIRIWKEQVAMIRSKCGLISFIVHPDYVINGRARRTYSDLLEYLCELRSQRQTWIALPREAAEWWRLRSELILINKNGTWHIEGKGRERAKLGYAVLNGDQIVYELPLTSAE